jgi:hypothetical protein
MYGAFEISAHLFLSSLSFGEYKDKVLVAIRVRPCLLNIKIFFQNIGLHSSCKGPQVDFRISTNEKHGF